MDTKSVFQDIQPLCINVAKKLDLNSVQDLEKYLEHIIQKERCLNESVSVLDDLKEYVAFPLILILKKENSCRQQELLLETVLTCLGKILTNALCLDWNFFKDVFSLLFLYITSSQNPQIVGNISEECKTEALQNVAYLCKALPPEHWHNLCSEAFRPQLGHAVYICLQIAEKEKNRLLKIIALNTVEELGLKFHSNQFNAKMNSKLGCTFAYFLPGIAMATTRIATAGEIQGHKVTVAALQCWQYFIFVVMRDGFLSTFVENLGVPSSLSSLQKKLFPLEKQGKNEINLANEKNLKSAKCTSDELEDNCGPKLKSVVIDGDWVESTSEKLLLLAKSLLSLVSHSHWRVRETLIHWCQSLFQHCSRSMNNCIIFCLEAVITLKSDPVVEVSKTAENALHLLKESFDPNDDGRLMELLEERVFALATKMPTIIKTQDDVQLLSSVRQLLGSLQVIGERIRSLVQMPSHLERIFRSLVVLFTYDYTDSDLLMEKMMSEDPFEVMSIKPHLGSSFRYFRSDPIIRCASTCCSLIGRHGDLILVVDQCLDLIQESSFYRNEALLLLNLIIKGAINQSNKSLRVTSEEKEKVVDSILGVLMSLEIFDAPLSVSENEGQTLKNEQSFTSLVSLHSFKPSVSVDLAKRNVILVSNALHITGNCALLLRKGFDMFLSRVLCSVMEKAGENNVLVSHSALLALENVATACGYKSVSELIEMSVPFFWFTLSQKLKQLPNYPSSPQVLRVVLKCHQGDVKTFVEELVEDILDSLDIFHAESSLPLLTVLLSFVDAVASNNNQSEINEASEEAAEADSNLPHIRSESLRKFIEEVHESHEAIERELREEAKIEEEENEESLSAEEGFRKHFEEEKKDEDDSTLGFQEEKKREIPNHVDLIVRILERCSYLLFVKERKSQLVILQIIKSCCYILHDWEDQKLPSFHKIWKPLVLRLKDKDFVVLLKALETCVLMVKSSGDFLKRRFLEQLFPSLVLFLESQSSTSLNKKRNSGYYLTPAFKAQRHVLENIPSLLRGLELDVLEAGELMNVILSYLDDRQPFLLKQLALEILKTLKVFHPDLVWMAISFSKGPFRITPPSSLLNPVAINGVKIHHLSENVLQLYEELC